MRRARLLLVSGLIAASTLASTAPGTFAAYQGQVRSNSDGFSASCLGYVDTYPQQLYSLAVGQMAKLGYAVTDASLGSAFTRSAFLTTVGKDYAVYVHSHDDNLSYAHVVSAKAPPRLAVVLCRRQATPGQLRGAGEPKSDRPPAERSGTLSVRQTRQRRDGFGDLSRRIVVLPRCPIGS